MTLKSRHIFLISVFYFLIACETQPPNDPTSITLQTGEVLLEINFSQNSNLNAEKIV